MEKINEDERKSEEQEVDTNKKIEKDSFKSNPECINNVKTTFFVSDHKKTITFYECPSSECHNISYMCIKCAQICHSHIDWKNMAKKEVFEKNVKCGCANDNHSFKGYNAINKDMKEDKELCNTQFSELLSGLKINLWATNADVMELEKQLERIDAIVYDFYCLYCFEVCKNKTGLSLFDFTNYNKLEPKVYGSYVVEKFMPKCSCNCINNHDFNIMKRKILKTFLKTNHQHLMHDQNLHTEYDKKIDKLSLMGLIFTNNKYFTKEFEIFEIKNIQIEKSINDPEDSNQKDVLKFTNAYLEIVELMEDFTNKNKKIVFDITSLENYQLKSFNIDTMINITSLLIKKEPVDHLEVSCGILPKMLQFYRHFYIIPKIQIKNLKSIIKHRENISPLHRHFFRSSLDVFFNKASGEDYKLNSETYKNKVKEFETKFMRLFNNVHDIIINLLKYGLETAEFASLIKQFLQYSELFLCYNIDNKFFIDIVHKILSILKFYKKNPNLFKTSKISNKKELHKQVTSQALYDEIKDNNQVSALARKDTLSGGSIKISENFKNKVFQLNYKESIENVADKIKEAYNETNKNEVTEAENKNNNKRLMIKSLNKDIRKIMPLLVTYLNDKKFIKKVFDGEEEDLGFIFEEKDNHLQANILEIIFFADINNFNGLFIYHSMLTTNDSFVDNLRYMLNSDYKFFVDNYSSIYKGEFTPKELFGKHGSDRIYKIPTLGLSHFAYERLKKNYFLSRNEPSNIDERTSKQNVNIPNKSLQMNNMELLFNLIIQNLQNEIKVALNLTSREDKFKKQLFLAKNGFLEIIIDYFKVITKNPFYHPQNDNEIVFYNNMIVSIFNMLQQITESNGFLASIFFSPKIINLFFSTDNYLYFFEILKFYNNLLETLYECKVKINIKYILDKLAKIDDKMYLSKKTGYGNNFANMQIVKLKELRKLFPINFNNNLIYLLSIYFNLLRVSTENNEVYVNDTMINLAKDILEDKEIKNLLDLYLEQLDGSNSKIEIEDTVIKIFEILNKISKNYFYMINPYIPTSLIENILKNASLNPVARLKIHKFYVRHALKLPYTRASNVMILYETVLNPDIKIKNLLLVNQINKKNIFLKVSDCSQKKKVIGKIDEMLDNNDPENNFPELKIVIFTMLNFNQNIEKFKKQHFDNNPNFLLKFFENVIVNSCLNSIYKILFFNNPITNYHKYYIYTIVNLFLNNFLFVLLNLLSRSKSDTEQFSVIYKRHFYFNDKSNDDDDEEQIRIPLEALYQNIENKKKEINSENYNYFDYRNLIKIFIDYVSQLRWFKKQNRQTNIRFIKVYNKHNNEFYKKVSQFYQDYKQIKLDANQNYMYKILKNQNDNELFQILKIKMIHDLIEKFEYYGSKHIEKKSRISESDLEEYIGSGFKDVFSIIKKSAKIDPVIYQEYIKLESPIIINDLNNILKYKIPYLFQFTLIEFCNINIDSYIPFNSILLDLLEFLEYICENNENFAKIIAEVDIPFFNKKCKFKELLLTLLSLILSTLSLYDKNKELINLFNPVDENDNTNFVKSKDNYFEIFMDRIFNLISKLVRECKTKIYSENVENYKEKDLDNDDLKNFESEDVVNSPTVYNIDIDISEQQIENKKNFISRMTNILPESKEKIKKFDYGFSYLKKLSSNILKDTSKYEIYKYYIYRYILFIDNVCFEYKAVCDINIKEIQNVMIYSFNFIYKKYVDVEIQQIKAVETKPVKKKKISNYSSISNDDIELAKFNENTKTCSNILKSDKKISNFLAGQNILFKIKEKEEILSDTAFVILSKLFILMKNISDSKQNNYERYKKFLENMKSYMRFYQSTPQQEYTRVEDVTKLILGSIYYVLDNLILSVEIIYKNNKILNLDKKKIKEDDEVEEIYKQNQDESKDEIIQTFFLIDYDGLQLDKESLELNFTTICPLNTGSNKRLLFLVDYNNYINTVVELNKKYSNKPNLIKFLRYIENRNLHYYSAFFSVITNILVGVTMSYGAKSASCNLVIVDNFYIWISLISGFHLILLASCITILCYNEYIKYEIFIQKFNNKKNDDLNYFRDFMNFRIHPLIWNFIFGFLAYIQRNLSFLYSLQLFSIFFIFPTMRAAIFAVKNKYSSFISTALLLLILVVFYSLISVIFFQPKFVNSDLNENACGNVFECILYLFTSGVRDGSGLGFSITNISDPQYWSQFIFSWVFYFTIILVLLNIFNGIIVDTFQSMRQENEKEDKKKNNTCYICSISRLNLESHGINYINHINEVHCLFSYMQFLLKVSNMTDDGTLNSAQLMVLNKLKTGTIDFLPVRQTRALNN